MVRVIHVDQTLLLCCIEPMPSRYYKVMIEQSLAAKCFRLIYESDKNFVDDVNPIELSKLTY